jgi:hypothetical protein
MKFEALSFPGVTFFFLAWSVLNGTYRTYESYKSCKSHSGRLCLHQLFEAAKVFSD